MKSDRLRYLGLLSSRLILGPILGQIKLIRDRQAGIVIGQRQRHRNLTVVLLAELAAILPGHPDRVPPLLGKARVVDDPGRDRPAALDRRQHQLAYFGQHRRVRPRRVADKMKQRLMLRGNLCRCRHRRHRLDALAFNRHQQPQTVIMHRLLSIGMTQHDTERLDIGRKTRFTPLTRCTVHPGPPIRIRMAPNTTSWGCLLQKYMISNFVTQ